ncbi:MAG: hypothetical protein N2B06_16880 [Clostridium sp.]
MKNHNLTVNVNELPETYSGVDINLFNYRNPYYNIGTVCNTCRHEFNTTCVLHYSFGKACHHCIVKSNHERTTCFESCRNKFQWLQVSNLDRYMDFIYNYNEIV